MRKDYIKGTNLIIMFLVLCFVFSLFSISMLLQSNTKELLKLDISNPKWWQFVTATYTNEDIKHYLDNILPFSLIFILQSILIVKINKNKLYLHLLFSTLILFPLIDSVLKIIIFPIILPNIVLSTGSSGIVSALVGFIPVIWILYLRKINNKIRLNYCYLCIFLFFIILSFLAVYYKNILLIILFLFLLSICLFMYKNDLIKIYNILISKNITWIHSFFQMLILLAFILLVFEAFPSQIKIGGNQIGILTHYFGLVYGVIASYYFLR